MIYVTYMYGMHFNWYIGEWHNLFHSDTISHKITNWCCMSVSRLCHWGIYTLGFTEYNSCKRKGIQICLAYQLTDYSGWTIPRMLTPLIWV